MNLIERIKKLELKERPKAKAYQVAWPEGMGVGEVPVDIVTISEPAKLKGTRLRLQEFYDLFPDGVVQLIKVEYTEGWKNGMA